MAVDPIWIPLNVHSQFSILDSTASVVALAERAKKFGIPSLALTDQGNLYGAVDFYKACKAAGIKPILGIQIAVAPGSRLEKKRIPGQPTGRSILLLAKNKTGYRNLCKLSSIGFLEGFYYQPRIDKEVLSQYAEGLVCLSPTLHDVDWYHELFKEDFYLEIQRHPLTQELIIEDGIEKEGWLLQKMKEREANEEKENGALVLHAKKAQIKLVATCDIHYIERGDWKAHELLLNVQSGEPVEIWERDSRGNLKQKVPNPKRETTSAHDLYFKSPEEMATLFSDLPEALSNTLEIESKCQCELDFKTKYYPVFIPPSLEGKSYTKEERTIAAEKFLHDLCVEAIPRRYPPELHAKVHDRFKYEFGILTSKGMCDYMLIVYDFISWAKKRGIPMGPGRGSAAGSIISYLTGITDIEPLRFHLFFERFINPERISYPDIDVDICMDRRQEVIDYVVAKYGKDKVAQIITFGTMKAKMAIRDIGRVLNIPLSKVNEIAALVPEDPTMTLEKAFQIDPELKRLMETDEEARSVLEMAQKAEGSIRNTSTHAAGLIISANPITDHIPVCTAKDSDMVVTQYAMKPVESVGMLKIDFLGLKTLTSLQKCVDALAKSGKNIEWNNLPLDDKKTFELLNQGKTLGVFQLESGGMRDLSKQLHIDVFEEIIAVCALYRPGPMDMIPSFINRKHGREPIEIDHPLMKEILSETYGVMVYQEQVMQIASNLAGYSLGEGDVLRRAMGKKDKEEMAGQRIKFINGAANHQIDADLAGLIFDKIEKFASYGFNKSHAAAYAYLSYATAYFKANHLKEWMAALMTCDRDDTTKLTKLIGEARALHIPVLLPDVNQAGTAFSAVEEGIRFAMSGIKGVGQGIVEAIVAEREQNGPYQSLYDFIQRIDKTRIGKKQIELLIDAGCFDFTKWPREASIQSVDAMYSSASRDQKEASLGILNLFSLIEEPAKETFSEPPPVLKKLTQYELLRREKELLGCYITGHPMDAYQHILGKLSCTPFREIENLSEGAYFRSAFIVESVQIKISNKSQKKFAILVVGDGEEQYELPIWSEMFEEKLPLIKENQLLYAILQADRREGAISLSCRYLDDLTTIDETQLKICDDLYDKLRSQPVRNYERKNSNGEKKGQNGEKKPQEEVKQFVLALDANRLRFSQILQLKELFRSHPGKSPLELQFLKGAKKIGTLKIDSQWGVKAGKSFLDELTPLLEKIGAHLIS